MRISNEELQRITDMTKSSPLLESSTHARLTEHSVVSTLETQEMNMITQALSHVPDVREQIVASLKERIESGTYQISGEQIAEMMIRRSLADRIR